MDKKKIITLSLCGTLVLGASACAGQQDLFDDTPSNVITDTAEIPATEQTETLDTAETPDATQQETETLSEPAELTEAELHALFESVYLESMESVKENPPKNKETQIAYEFNQLEAECEQGKKLPSDYKVQYREWRENYKLSDLSILFTDVMQEMYIINSAYTYADIYKDSKLSLLVGGEEVYVTGIGFDAATNWYRIENEYGESYIESENVSAKQLIENQFTSVNEVRYAIREATGYKVPQVNSTQKFRVVKNGDAIKVIGIGYGEAEGWLKVDYGEGILGGIGYVRAEHFKLNGGNSGNSGGQQDNGSSGQQDNGSSEGSGGQQDNNGSGGDQGSNNSGGNTGDYWVDKYGMTGEELRDLPAEELIALGFTQYPDGSWVNERYMALPAPEATEEALEKMYEECRGSLGSG